MKKKIKEITITARNISQETQEKILKVLDEDDKASYDIQTHFTTKPEAWAL